MTKTLRASSIAASLAMLSFSTMAAAVTLLPTITFENQAQQVIDLGEPVLANSTPELSIQNAWVYAVGLPFNVFDVEPPADTQGAYVVNRSRNASVLEQISLELRPAAANPTVKNVSPAAAALESFVTSFTYDIFAFEDYRVLFLDVNGNVVADDPVFVGGGGATVWSRGQTNAFDVSKQVSKVVFDGGANGALGLDNFKIELTQGAVGGGGGGGGGNVPEPASYALVAMALLAAGGASRQRKA